MTLEQILHDGRIQTIAESPMYAQFAIRQIKQAEAIEYLLDITERYFEHIGLEPDEDIMAAAYEAVDECKGAAIESAKDVQMAISLLRKINHDDNARITADRLTEFVEIVKRKCEG